MCRTEARHLASAHKFRQLREYLRHALLRVFGVQLSTIRYTLASYADVDYRISKASAAFGALSYVLRNKHVSSHLRGEVYKALVLSTLLYGCEVWCLREDLFNRLRSSYKRCIRRMCRVSLHHAFHHHISSATLSQGLNVMDLDSYYHNRILRCAGHVARMPTTRAPRQMLTGWVAHSRPNGCPEMTWGRALKMALKCKGLPVDFKEWRFKAEDRSEWRSRTYVLEISKSMPPSKN